MIIRNEKINQALGNMDLSYKPLPGSQKVYFSGQIYPDLRVPFRRIDQSSTVDQHNNSMANPALTVYDTSGPYTDKNIKINIAEGLLELALRYAVQLSSCTAQHIAIHCYFIILTWVRQIETGV